MDTVRSTLVNTSLLDFIDGFALENLIGNAAVNGVGNENDNLITGNGRNNSSGRHRRRRHVLGGSGNDVMRAARATTSSAAGRQSTSSRVGAGVDIRIGGTGNDIFVFAQLTPGEVDLINIDDGAVNANSYTAADFIL